MMQTKLDKEMLDSMSKNPGNWRGVFYKNKKDYRLIVPKQNPSLGWTINFSSPYAYLFLIAFVLILIVFAFFVNPDKI
jgi:uncharacterized membrane protein